MRIRTPKLDPWFEIYRDGHRFATVLTWTSVLDCIFDDHVKTRKLGEKHDYSFRYVGGRL